jgi:hypothetical protein
MAVATVDAEATAGCAGDGVEAVVVGASDIFRPQKNLGDDGSTKQKTGDVEVEMGAGASDR